MKIKIFLIGLCSLFIFYACEQEEIDPGKVKSNVMSGEWYVRYDHPLVADISGGFTRLVTSSTASESTTEMILTDEQNFWWYRVKCAINEATKTFGSADTLISYETDYNIKIVVRNGKIIDDAVELPSGVVTDSIYFEIWFEDFEDGTGIPNDYLQAAGYRRTGFLEDEP